MSPSPSVVAPDLRDLAGLARPLTLAGERVLPVFSSLEPLLPERGLRRGSVVATSGRAGATSLALALVAAASAEGSWCAAVCIGRPVVGLAAAAEIGVVLERFPVVSAVGGNGPGGWAWVVAALLDAFDVVVAWPPAHVLERDARRLAARGRERGAVLVLAGVDFGARAGWPAPVDVQLRVSGVAWHGVGRGHGRLEARSMDVVAGGRGAAARERRVNLWLPSAETGSVSCAQRAVIRAESGEITALRVHQTVS